MAGAKIDNVLFINLITNETKYAPSALAVTVSLVR